MDEKNNVLEIRTEEAKGGGYISVSAESRSKEHLTEKNPVPIYNKAVLANTTLSLNGQRLLRTVISLIKPIDLPNKKYIFQLSEFEKLYGIKDARRQIKQAAVELAKRSWVPVQDGKNGERLTGWIDHVYINDSIVSVEFDKELLPIYQRIKELVYPIRYIKGFESTYSFKFYELFVLQLGSESGVKIYKDLEDIKVWLDIKDKYIDKRTGKTSYTSIRKKIIDPVMKDINGDGDGMSTNLKVTYTEEKQGKSVVGLTFVVSRMKEHDFSIDEVPPFNPFYENLSDAAKIAYDKVISPPLNLSKNEIERSIRKWGEVCFCDICEYIDSLEESFGFLFYKAACVRNGWFSDVVTDDELRYDNFEGLYKEIMLTNAQKGMLDDVYAFLKDTKDSIRIAVYTDVLDRLKSQVHAYAHVRNIPLEVMLENKQLLYFVLFVAHEVVNSARYVKAYNEFFVARSRQEAGKNLSERVSIVKELHKHGIVADNIIEDILTHSDDYILANIRYCEKNYAAKNGKKGIAGIIISAIQRDYAGFTSGVFVADDKNSLNSRIQDAIKEYQQNAGKQDTIVVAGDADVRQAEVNKEHEELDEAFVEFLASEDNSDDIDLLKRIVNRNSFIRGIVSRNLGIEDMLTAPIGRLMENPAFATAFKGAWKLNIYTK